MSTPEFQFWFDISGLRKHPVDSIRENGSPLGELGDFSMEYGGKVLKENRIGEEIKTTVVKIRNKNGDVVSKHFGVTSNEEVRTSVRSWWKDHRE